MSSNSKASSFDPYAYYKQITNCIAKKNNFKVDFSEIPGYEKSNGHIKKPLITKQHLAAKFLAKYVNKKQEQETEKQQQTSQFSKRGITEKEKPKHFIVKPPLETGKSKKTKEQPCFINLPDSFFHSYSGPDVSIFKVPEVPPIKRAEKRAESQQPIEPKPGPNSTMETVNSAAFNPEKASTPLNEPIISDPDDIFNSRISEDFFSLASILTAPQETSSGAETKKFLDVAERAAKMLESEVFENVPDPLIAIRRRLKEIYDHASISPREINETLRSDNEVKTSTLKLPATPQKYSFPIPKFYDEPEGKPEKKETLSPLRLASSQTHELFNWMEKGEILDKFEETPFTMDVEINDEFTLGKNLKSPDKDLFFFATPQSTILVAAKSHNISNDSLFEFSPTIDFTMNCEFPDIDCLNTENFDNTFAVFTSPPGHYRPPVQSSSLPVPLYQRSLTRSSQHSQRSQKKNEKVLKNHVNSSLSTYRWTPNLNHISLMDKSISSSSQPYPFEPRNILKNSFESSLNYFEL